MNKLLVYYLQVVALGMFLRPFAGSTKTSMESSKSSRREEKQKINAHQEVDPSTCTHMIELYEYPGVDPNGGSSSFNQDIQLFVVADKPLYLDAGLKESANMTIDAVCKSLDQAQDHFLCHVIATHENALATLTGIITKFDYEDGSENTSENTYVLTGGTDMYAGITGKVTSVLKGDVIVNTVCFQGPYL